MDTAASARQARVRDVVRDVVADVAPEELPVVDGLCQLDDRTVVRRLEKKPRPEELGYGWTEIAVLVTAIVWLVLDHAAKSMAESAVNGAGKGLKALLRKLFRRRTAAPVTVPPLTREQLTDVWQHVHEAAVEQRLSAGRASAIADAVVRRLALDPPERNELEPHHPAGKEEAPDQGPG